MNHPVLTRARYALAGALLGAAGLLAACDSGTPATAVPATTAPSTAATATPATTGGGGAEVAVALNEWKIEPATINVAAGHQKFTVTNNGKFAHDFSITANGKTLVTPKIPAGQSATLETDLAAGTYPSVCDIPGHADQGMKANVIVK
jgi:uncharacterized cupredoxin-like copper-binding protein